MDYTKDLFDSEGDSTQITLGFSEDVHLYTPVVAESTVVELAEEFGVAPGQILSALRRLWFEMVQDQRGAFDQRLAELRYDSDAATHFAQRFL